MITSLIDNIRWNELPGYVKACDEGSFHYGYYQMDNIEILSEWIHTYNMIRRLVFKKEFNLKEKGSRAINKEQLLKIVKELTDEDLTRLKSKLIDMLSLGLDDKSKRKVMLYFSKENNLDKIFSYLETMDVRKIVND